MIHSLREPTLRRAFSLMQQGHPRPASRLLARLLRQYPNDYHAWWLFANCAPHQADVVMALEQVLRLQPQHEKARRMLANLHASNIKLGRAQAIAPDATGELGRVEVRCRSCGALTAVEVGVVVERCAFCGGSHLVTEDGHDPRQAIQAEAILPFIITPQHCQQLAQSWFGRGWLTPPSLREWATLGRFSAIYLPFWAIRAEVRGTWEYRDDERVQRGSLYFNLRNILQPATTQLGDELIERTANYDLAQIDPYRLEATAGVAVQLAELAPYQALTAVRRKMHLHMQAHNSLLALPNTAIFPKYENEVWQPILVPSYLATYHYRGRIFKVMVNGQTGHISGQRPVDWIKVAGLALIALLPGLFILGYCIALRQQLIELGLQWVLLLPFFLLLLGGAACWYLLREAFSYDNV
jgi:hypothetical protein